MAKPTGSDLNVAWGEGAAADVLEPSLAKEGLLFQADERPANNYFNWFLRTISRWLVYLKDFESFARTWTAAQTFDGAAGDGNAALLSAPAITTRKLLWQIGGGASAYVIRIYRTSAGVWELTWNAAWRPGNSDWLCDSVIIGARTTNVWKVAVGLDGWHLYAPDTSVQTGAFVDSKWERIGVVGTDGLLKFINTSTRANPAKDTAIANTLCAKNTPKAFGTISYPGNGSVDLTRLDDGFNVSALSGTNDILQVTFASPMADANYAVVATNLVPPAQGAVLVVTGKETGHFHMAWQTAGASPVNLDGVSWGCDFVVFGKQST